jgi:hypothetical protein
MVQVVNSTVVGPQRDRFNRQNKDKKRQVAEDNTKSTRRCLSSAYQFRPIDHHSDSIEIQRFHDHNSIISLNLRYCDRTLYF